MLALSIRQPWASMIMTAGKDIENREWSTRVRGRILVHAAKGCTYAEMAEGLDYAESVTGTRHHATPKTIARGGFVGTVEIVDCVKRSMSPWFFGAYGFVLRDPEPMDFVPWKGQLGFFDVTEEALQAARAAFLEESTHA